jgi:hypothetical protein
MKQKFLSILALFLLVPSAYASFGNFPGATGDIFESIHRVLQNSNVVYTLLFILLFVLLYSIYAIGLRKMNAFGGGSLDKFGKTICISLSLMSTIGIFTYFIKKGGYSLLIKSNSIAIGKIPSNLWYIILFIAAIIFLITSFGTRWKNKINYQSGMIIAGLTLMILGSFIKHDSLVSMGFGSFMIGLLFLLFGHGLGDNYDNDVPGPGPNPHDPGPNFTRILDQLSQLLNNYHNYFTHDFTDACNDILRTNHARTSVTDPQWTTLINCIDALNNQGRRINNAFEQITTHPDFARMNAPDSTRYTDMTTLWGGYMIITQETRVRFHNKFVAGEDHL